MCGGLLPTACVSIVVVLTVPGMVELVLVAVWLLVAVVYWHAVASCFVWCVEGGPLPTPCVSIVVILTVQYMVELVLVAVWLLAAAA